MKFTLIFLISILVVHAHQYFHVQPREMHWLSPHPPQPFIDEYQPFIVYISKPDSPKIYSSEDLSAGMLEYDARLFNAGHTGSEREFQENSNAAETQPRVKSSLEEVKPRLFFGVQRATFTNPFFKTATFTVSSTITVSSLVRCIPTGIFRDAAAQKTPCRRKRDTPESLETSKTLFAIAPSEPRMTTASLPPVDQMQENSSRTMARHTHDGIILSSKDEIETLKSAALDSNLRNKRFLFYPDKDANVASTTVTSLSVVTTVTTLTASNPIDANKLICVPNGYRVC